MTHRLVTCEACGGLGSKVLDPGTNREAIIVCVPCKGTGKYWVLGKDTPNPPLPVVNGALRKFGK